MVVLSLLLFFSWHVARFVVVAEERWYGVVVESVQDVG
jgi:hypothetical protein